MIRVSRQPSNMNYIPINYIPWNMHTLSVVLCFVAVIMHNDTCITAANKHKLYPMEYAHFFVVLCFVAVIMHMMIRVSRQPSNINYIPWNMHTFFVMLCFVVIIMHNETSITAVIKHKLYPMKYAHFFVMLCFSVVIMHNDTCIMATIKHKLYYMEYAHFLFCLVLLWL